MRRLCIVIGIVLFSLFGAAQQQPVPEGIIVQPNQTPLALQLSLDKASYSPGDKLRLTITLNQDSYVYIYNITPDRRVHLLFPNAYQPENLLRAGTHTIPNRRYSLVISPPTGFECIQVLALAAPLPLEQLIPGGKFAPQSPFPLLSQQPQEFKALMQGLIVGTVSTTGWAAAWSCFQIAPPHARLRIVSDPSGALVSINNVVMGQTPFEMSLAPGRYRVVLSRFGYEEWSRTLDLKPNSEVTLEARLMLSPFFRPLGRTARLHIVSDPDDADVFINGAYAGRTPLSIEIAPGRYRVVVTKTNYESWSQTLELKGDSEITLEALLKPLAMPPTPPVLPTPPPVPPMALSEPTVLLGLNGGLSTAQIPSVGFDFGFAIGASFAGLGVSFSLTGEDVPAYENIGSPIDLGPTVTYREGPETEFYGKLSLALLGGLGIDIAGGIAVQKEAHIALPLVPSGFSALDVVVKPNGYQTEKIYLTGLIGLSLRSENFMASVGMHNRRGWVIGVGVVF
ncbi:MAG: PEGA domain-containing protein [Candidatus Bipolaricaulota bacterium]|nr:PEGA domain-containing protein [Candidatus Bipolaricaulota bacterium]